MVTISFPNWSDALEAAELPDKARGRHRVIINWFLGLLKREDAAASKATAWAFLEHLIETRRPQDWLYIRASKGDNDDLPACDE